MPFVFRCPACGRDLEAPDGVYNVAGSCRFCGAQIVSTSAQEGSATLIAAGPTGRQPSFGDVSQPTGRLRPFEILSEAWKLYQTNPGWILLSVFILSVFNGCLGHLSNALAGGGSRRAALLGGAFGVLTSPIYAAPFYVAARLATGRQVTVRSLWQGWAHAGPLIATSIVVGLPWTAVFLWLLRPAPTNAGLFSPEAASAQLGNVFLSIGLASAVSMMVLVPLSLAMMEVVDKGCGVLDALRASLRATRGHYFALLATEVLLAFSGLSGIILCGIGILFTAPISLVGQVLIYRHLRGLQGTPDV